MRKKRPISHSEFMYNALTAKCTAGSVNSRPGFCEEARKYMCTVEELLSLNTYPCYFVNASGKEKRQWNDPDAQPILFRSFAQSPTFMPGLVDNWFNPDKGSLNGANLITLHCAACDRRVVIDGVHRLLWLATHGHLSDQIQVTELSGRSWPPNTPDLNIICEC